MRTWMIVAIVAALLAPATAQAKPLELVVTGTRPTQQSGCMDCGRGRPKSIVDTIYRPGYLDKLNARRDQALRDAQTAAPETVYAQGLALFTQNKDPGDQDFGLKLMEIAAERGNETAQRKLGDVHPDSGRACYWREQVAQKGAPSDWLIAGRGCGQSDDPIHRAHALGWYNLAAEAGNVDAQLTLARMFLPPAPHPDIRLGLYWEVRAAEAGNVNAMRTSADLYLGRPGETDPVRLAIRDRRLALEWYKRAGDTGDTYAMLHAGDLYMGLSNDGDPALATIQDRSQALSWYRRAAAVDNADGDQAVHRLCLWPRDDTSTNRGDAMAACWAGYQRHMYLNGDALSALTYALFSGNGLPRDYNRALEVAKRSLNPETDYYRGQILAFGLGGNAADPDIGWHLIEWAAQGGNENAKTWLKNHSRPAGAAPDLDLVSLPTGQYRLSVTLNGMTTTADPAAALVTAVAGAGNAVYPERALNDEVENVTTLYCRWNAAGMIDDCTIDDENMAGYGFAQTAIKMLKSLKISAQDENAWIQASNGKTSMFLIRFRLQ